MSDEPHRDLNDFELSELVSSQPTAVNRQRVMRLLTELRRLRDEAGERERLAAQEQVW